MRTVTSLVFSLGLLIACEAEGPIERAGEEVDEAVEDVRAGSETVENRLDDAVDDVRARVEDAADEVRGVSER